jgi:hypothetical protein
VKKLFVAIALAFTAMWWAAAFAQSDLDPPSLAHIQVEPSFVDTSQGSQVVTVTARITDNLSGCADNNWCINFKVQPLFGPATQIKDGFFDYNNRISGVATDGIYQTTITLPRFSYEGRWVLSNLGIVDAVGNRCVWQIDRASSEPCSPDVSPFFFINRVDDLQQIFLPLISTNELCTNSRQSTMPRSTRSSHA